VFRDYREIKEEMGAHQYANGQAHGVSIFKLFEEYLRDTYNTIYFSYAISIQNLLIIFHYQHLKICRIGILFFKLFTKHTLRFFCNRNYYLISGLKQIFQCNLDPIS